MHQDAIAQPRVAAPPVDLVEQPEHVDAPEVDRRRTVARRAGVRRGVRPIGAPDDALGVRVDQRPRDAVGFLERVVARCDPVRRGHLDPAASAAQRAQQLGHARLVRAAVGPGQPHVVDDDGHGRRVDRVGECGDAVEMDEELHVPAERRDQRRGAVERGAHRGGIALPDAREVDAHAARAARIEVAHVVGRRARLQADDRPRAIAQRRDGVERAAVVVAVDARLDDDDARDAERVRHREVARQRRLARRVAVPHDRRVPVGRPEHVHVAVGDRKRKHRPSTIHTGSCEYSGAPGTSTRARRIVPEYDSVM